MFEISTLGARCPFCRGTRRPPGQSLHSVSMEYGIPIRTLRRHRDGRVRRPGKVVLGNKLPVFSEEYKEQLVAYIREMEIAMRGLTLKDIRRLAYDVAVRAGLGHNFDRASKLTGRSWAYAFLKRHPELTLRVATSTSLDGFNSEAVGHFFAIYKGILAPGEFGPNNVWNCDETGFSTVTKPGKVIATKGVRQVRKVSSGERGRNVTALCCMSAAGVFVPPLFVFPRKRLTYPLMNGAPAGTIGAVNERGKGYIDTALFFRWMQHFVAMVGCTKENQHILLADGHESHKSLQVISYAKENGVILITLPPHCTHRLQPLDRTFF